MKKTAYDTDALLTAVAILNPDGRESVSGREAADFAGLAITASDLDDLVRDLCNAIPKQLVAHAPRTAPPSGCCCGSLYRRYELTQASRPPESLRQPQRTVARTAHG